VTLEGLEVGTKYQLKGWQMLKEENAELVINGKRIENDYTFIANNENMEVQVVFTFDASSFAGKQIVTFEELYDLSNPDEPKKVAEHKDLEDDGQTVSFKEKTIVYEEPQNPETPHKLSELPKTGDSTNIYKMMILFLASGSILLGTYFFKNRRKGRE
ncbi:MAG: VaFE repeat-containing surface-anchored protein, partial [Clostridium paraputrificum]